MTAAVNQRVRTMPAADGGVVVLGVWCSACREEVGPGRDGTCTFCGSLVYDEDSLSARDAVAALNTPRPGGPMTSTLTRVMCKTAGCDAEAEDRQGPYAKLCAPHKQDAKAARAAAPKVPRVAGVATSDGAITASVKQLVPLAKSLDRARSRIEGLPSNQQAKAAFDEAVRRASASPSPDNLRRVAEATKVLQKAAPKRTKLEVELSEVERSFSLALDAVLALNRPPVLSTRRGTES